MDGWVAEFEQERQREEQERVQNQEQRAKRKPQLPRLRFEDLQGDGRMFKLQFCKSCFIMSGPDFFGLEEKKIFFFFNFWSIEICKSCLIMSGPEFSELGEKIFQLLVN